MLSVNIGLAVRKPLDIQFVKVKDFPFHWHDSLELIIVLKGSIQVAIIDETRTVEQGNIEIINLSQVHRMWSKDEENLVVLLHIDGEFAKFHYPELSSVWLGHAFSPGHSWPAEKLQVVNEQIFTTLLPLIGAETPDRQTVQDVGRELILLLALYFDLMKNNFGDRPQKLMRARRLYNYLYNEMKFTDRITLQDIAIQTEEYLNLDYLSVQLKSWAGDSLHNLLNYFRIEHAVKLLLATNQTIATIAAESGFSAPRYFYKRFNAFFSEGPANFRRENKHKLARSTTAYFETGDTGPSIAAWRSLVGKKMFFGVELPNRWTTIFLFGPVAQNDGIKEKIAVPAALLADPKERYDLVLQLSLPRGTAIALYGLFADEGLCSRSVEGEAQNNWGLAFEVIQCLKRNGRLPLFAVTQAQFRSPLLTEFIDSYTRTYGEEAITGWRFELVYSEWSSNVEQQQF
ncbi:DNA-binding transcriptional regulator MelR [compost metagenome]